MCLAQKADETFINKTCTGVRWIIPTEGTLMSFGDSNIRENLARVKDPFRYGHYGAFPKSLRWSRTTSIRSLVCLTCGQRVFLLHREDRSFHTLKNDSVWMATKTTHLLSDLHEIIVLTVTPSQSTSSRSIKDLFGENSAWFDMSHPIGWRKMSTKSRAMTVKSWKTGFLEGIPLSMPECMIQCHQLTRYHPLHRVNHKIIHYRTFVWHIERKFVWMAYTVTRLDRTSRRQTYGDRLLGEIPTFVVFSITALLSSNTLVRGGSKLFLISCCSSFSI